MTPPQNPTFVVTPDLAQLTLAALLRRWLPGESWSRVHRLIETRRVTVNDEVCLDAARRMREGLTVCVLPNPAPRPRQQESVVIRYLDEHLVVVEKPSGVNTVRHPSERGWKETRKALSPTLQDLTPPLIAAAEGRRARQQAPRLRVVQRLDKETSGLVVFARGVEAERGLGKQFFDHTVVRRYLALVPGHAAAQRIATRLVRDRGDGKRGSTQVPELGKEAVTHVEVVERLPGYTLLRCRLETGRTHQIRIHLAELGHPVCGDKVYRGPLGVPPVEDGSRAPRLFLHAAELGFFHPASGETLHWTMDLPPDLAGFLRSVKGSGEEPRP